MAWAQVYEELEKFGRIEELNVCANLGDHMIGNVYVKYEEEEMAEKVPSSPLLLPPSLPPSSLLLALTVRRETVCVCMCVCGDGVVTVW